MRIVHYSLGFPPFRRGGMIKYCVDLMAEQVRQENDVSLLWPGKLGRINDSCSVLQGKSHLIADVNIGNFELRNSLPVPLLNGIKDIEAYTHHKSVDTFVHFFMDNKIDVFHVHTLMGLPFEALEACHRVGVKTVFTSHDYFGICPKWGLERNGMPCIEDHGCADCVACNRTALSINKVRFLQSNIYRSLKNTSMFKVFRARNNQELLDEGSKLEVSDISNININQSLKYRELRSYYIRMLKMFDVLHFNSTNTMNVYGRYLDVAHSGKVISITHGSIIDHRILRVSHSPIRFGYLGPIDKHKGFFTLKAACDRLYQKCGKLFELHIFASTNISASYLVKHNPYQYEDLPNVMDAFDVLVVPSQWYETFGFTVLEALSFGVPVIVTENVGAKDLIVNDVNGLIVKSSAEFLENGLENMIRNPKTITAMNHWIVNNQRIKTLPMHVDEIHDLYIKTTMMENGK